MSTSIHNSHTHIKTLIISVTLTHTVVPLYTACAAETKDNQEEIATEHTYKTAVSEYFSPAWTKVSPESADELHYPHHQHGAQNQSFLTSFTHSVKTLLNSSYKALYPPQTKTVKREVLPFFEDYARAGTDEKKDTVIQKMLTAIDINAIVGDAYSIPLLTFAIQEQSNTLAKALINLGADIHQTDEVGGTALIEAIRQNSTDMATFLIKRRKYMKTIQACAQDNEGDRL